MADYAFTGWFSSLCAPHPCVDGLSCDSQPPYVGGTGTSSIEQMRRLRLREEVKDSPLAGREVSFSTALVSAPETLVFLPYSGPEEPTAPPSPATVTKDSQAQVWGAPNSGSAPSALPAMVESQARGLSEPMGSCWLAASDALFGGSARATVTWWLVQSPEPIPEGPTAALALCPTVTLLPSGSLWRLPASLPPINHVCWIYFLQQFISANAIWVCPQVGRMLCCRQSHGARLYCQTDRHDSPAPPRQMHQSPRVGH